MIQTQYANLVDQQRQLENAVHYGVSGNSCNHCLFVGPLGNGTYEFTYPTIIKRERLDIEARCGRKLENVRR